jgi:hypothetical protein
MHAHVITFQVIDCQISPIFGYRSRDNKTFVFTNGILKPGVIISILFWEISLILCEKDRYQRLTNVE